MRPIARILFKTMALVVVLTLAIFYLRLGWFLLPIWLAGAGIALLLSRTELRTFWSWVAGIVLTLVIYLASTTAVWQLFFDRTSVVVFDMAWEDKGDQNDFGETEIVLTFVQFPGNTVGIFSDDLRDNLEPTSRPVVPVTFEITRDLGCMRGFHETQIGELDTWRSVWGYSGATGTATSPWGPDPWWCP